jgi:hypothetical protein
MGNRPDAYLVFGYDLGSNFYNVKEYDKTTYDLKLNWTEETYLDDEEAEERLQDQLGDSRVEIVTYGGAEEPSYVLVAKDSVFHTDWDDSLILSELPDRMQPKVIAAYTALLQRALIALGMTPLQEQPNWLLLADYDD